jgi:hypothetical protein
MRPARTSIALLPLLLLLLLHLVCNAAEVVSPLSHDVQTLKERAFIEVDRSGCMDMSKCARQFDGCQCVEWNAHDEGSDLTCRNQSGYLGDYLYFYYCLMNPSLRPLSLCLIVGAVCLACFYGFRFQTLLLSVCLSALPNVPVILSLSPSLSLSLVCFSFLSLVFCSSIVYVRSCLLCSLSLSCLSVPPVCTIHPRDQCPANFLFSIPPPPPTPIVC